MFCENEVLKILESSDFWALAEAFRDIGVFCEDRIKKRNLLRKLRDRKIEKAELSAVNEKLSSACVALKNFVDGNPQLDSYMWQTLLMRRIELESAVMLLEYIHIEIDQKLMADLEEIDHQVMYFRKIKNNQREFAVGAKPLWKYKSDILKKYSESY
jgi:hypothetical protein